jgi:ornithine carbamoyltransferase
VDEAKEAAKSSGSKVILTQDLLRQFLMQTFLCRYMDKHGQEDQKEEKLNIFMPYQINSQLFAKANEDAIFLHCLPAYRGYEVTEDVIDGAQSVIFDEAENRLHAQKAVMATLMG